MRVLERYILRRIFVFFIGALFWTMAIVWTTQVLARIDLVTDGGQSAVTFFKVASLILPSVVPLVMAFSVLIAVAQTLTAMNNDSELVVFSAAGASRMAAIKPVLLLAAAASVSGFVVDNSLDPYARQRGREIVAEARGDLISLVIQEGTFRRIEDKLWVQIAQRLPDGRLGGIFIADSRDRNVDLVYYAKTGVVAKLGDKSVLVMQEGELHRKPRNEPLAVVRFTSNAFDLSSFTPGSNQVKLLPKDRTLPYLFNPDPNDRLFQREPQAYRSEIHRRLTEWVYPLVFGLIVLAVAGDPRSHRQQRVHPLVTAAAVALFVRWLGFFTADQAQTSPLWSPLVYAVPICASLVAIGFIAANKPMELPLSVFERIAEPFRRANAWLAAKRDAALGRASPTAGAA
jgi:lipopolysaccharide export system permease protein